MKRRALKFVWIVLLLIGFFCTTIGGWAHAETLQGEAPWGPTTIEISSALIKRLGIQYINFQPWEGGGGGPVIIVSFSAQNRRETEEGGFLIEYSYTYINGATYKYPHVFGGFWTYPRFNCYCPPGMWTHAVITWTSKVKSVTPR